MPDEPDATPISPFLNPDGSDVPVPEHMDGEEKQARVRMLMARLQTLAARAGYRPPAPTDVPDPLAEKFEELEADVAARELAERQANCPHVNTVDISTHDRPDLFLCPDCGAEGPLLRPGSGIV